jgi:hypothetical protein
MAGKRREKVREKDITGLKYFDRLLPLFERLHEVGCERDKAGNRTLHMDQYCVLVLLYEVLRYVPTRMDLTRNGGGDCDERSVLARVYKLGTANSPKLLQESKLRRSRCMP